MFPRNCLDMSIRLPYFGDQLQIDNNDKVFEKQTMQYFAGYSTQIVAEKDKGSLAKFLCAYCVGLPRNCQKMDCGHRTCKTCYDFRIFVSKHLEDTSDEVFCPTCRSEHPMANRYAWLNIQLLPDYPLIRQESKHITIKECPVKNCEDWKGGSLFSFYRHEATHHAHLESKSSLSAISMDNYKLLCERLVIEGKYLDGVAEDKQKSRKKKRSHKVQHKGNTPCSDKRATGQTCQKSGNARKSTELTVNPLEFNEGTPDARKNGHSEDYQRIVQFLQKQWDQAVNSPGAVWYEHNP